MIRAKIIESAAGSLAKGRGDYEFVQLPAPKDRLTLANKHGSVHMMEVLYVQHIPSPVHKSNDTSRQAPEAYVFVQEVENYWDPRWPRTNGTKI